MYQKREEEGGKRPMQPRKKKVVPSSLADLSLFPGGRFVACAVLALGNDVGLLLLVVGRRRRD